MSINKEKWMEEAAYKLDLLYEFDEIFLVPDAKTLNAFLKQGKKITQPHSKNYWKSMINLKKTKQVAFH